MSRRSTTAHGLRTGVVIASACLLISSKVMSVIRCPNLLQPDARIQEGVGNVHGQIDEHDQRGDEQRYPLDNG